MIIFRFRFFSGKFDEDCARFYAAQIVFALRHMHSLNIIHRNLTPENILFNDNMQIQIAGFGTAKELPDDDVTREGRTRSSSFVGTVQYFSPELLKDKQAGISSDLWALGCILFQMLTGKRPFQAQTENLTFNQILNCSYQVPRDIANVAKDLIGQLLQLDPMQRIGCVACGGYEGLMGHRFFEGIDWDALPSAPAPDVMMKLADKSCDDIGLGDQFYLDMLNRASEKEQKVNSNGSYNVTNFCLVR